MNAAQLYLHLAALGQPLSLIERPEAPDGVKVRVGHLRKQPPAEQERIGELIAANRPALIALLRSGSPDAISIRQEGCYGKTVRIGAQDEEERRGLELVRDLARVMSEDVASDLPVEYRARVLRCLTDMIEIRRSWLEAAGALVAHLEQVKGEDGRGGVDGRG